MKTQSKYYFCIPEKVMVEFNSLEAMAQVEIPHFNSSYLKEILTLIALHERKEEGTARLKSSYINKLIPQYQEYFRFLTTLGIIKRSNRYVVGEKSYEYGFTPEYESRFKYFGIKDMYLVRRLERNALTRHNTKKYPGQAKFIRQMTIEPEALDFISKLPTKKFNAALISILKIQQGRAGIYYSVDSTSGRFHSNLTNLPEILRQFIRIEGKALSNIDIKNSQPYLSTLLLTSPQKVVPFAKDRKFAMLLQKLYSIDSMDVTMFNFLATKGRIYEFLMDKGFARDRKDAKKKLFTVMFGPACYESNQHQIFYDWFPNVYERFQIIKGNLARGSKFSNFKRFAILLQTVEAHLVLDTILPRVNTEHPGTIAVTIHDSVMTSILTTDIIAVKNIMVDELTRFVGIHPTLKVENGPRITAGRQTEGGEEEGGVGNITSTITLVQTA